MNFWHGKGRHVYQKYKGEWRKELAGTWSLWGKATGKRILTVRRYVRQESHLIADDDNFRAALKPVADVLVEIGVLTDDRREAVDVQFQQFVGIPQRTEIEVKNV